MTRRKKISCRVVNSAPFEKSGMVSADADRSNNKRFKSDNIPDVSFGHPSCAAGGLVIYTGWLGVANISIDKPAGQVLDYYC